MVGTNLGIVVLFAIAGFVISWVAIPLILQSFASDSRRQLHHTHTESISRFGGLALVLPFALLAWIALILYPDRLGRASSWVILPSALAMFLVGFWDDCKPLGAKRKLLLQILIASVVYFGGLQIGTFRNPINQATYSLGVWGYFATVFWLVAFTNLINLIDGIDGLAGGISLMVMALLVFVGFNGELTFPLLCAATMCGAILGFLRFNFPPAVIYLGDGGAYFLGFLAGILSLVHSHKGTVAAALIAPLFVLALPIIDVSLAMLRRGLHGLPLFRPDRRHLHHRLADAGLSRTRIVLLLYGFSAVFMVLALVVFLSKGRWLPVVFGTSCLVLLVSAGSFRFSRNWLSISKVLGKSIAVRKQTRHALALQRWLELEADLTSSLDELWHDFSFACEKIGFSQVILHMPHMQRVWQRSVGPVPMAMDLQATFKLPGGQSLEVSAPNEIGVDGFHLVSELAAETWVKISERCEANRKRKSASPPSREIAEAVN